MRIPKNLACLSLVLTLVLTMPVFAHASPFTDGLEAYEQGDYASAMKWFLRAAEQGDTNAQYSLGYMNYRGEGTPQDYTEAAKWYRKAAEQGHADAQLNLGVMYYKGEDVPQDYAEAVKWYRKAAEQGDASAQFNLGLSYCKGEGAPQDYVEAYKWANLSAAQGNTNAAKLRDLLTKGMTREQIAEGQRLSREWKPKQ